MILCPDCQSRLITPPRECCKNCLIKKKRQEHYRKQKKNREPKTRPWRKYGLTEVHYKKLRKNQGNRCAICKEVSKLVIDHNHETGSVRGLLCVFCNSGLGFFKDNRQYLWWAGQYLKKHEEIKDGSIRRT